MDVDQQYIVGAIILISIIIIIFYNCKEPEYGRKKYSVVVMTKKGLVSAPKKMIANEMQSIYDELKYVHRLPECEFDSKVDEAIVNLDNFIKENRISEENLCKFDAMENTIHTISSDVELMAKRSDVEDIKHKSVLALESHERELQTNTKYRFNYLLNRIDIIINLLRQDVCDYGKIDLRKLHDILTMMGRQICSGKNIVLDYGQIKGQIDLTHHRKLPVYEGMEPMINDENVIYTNKSSKKTKNNKTREYEKIILKDYSIENAIRSRGRLFGSLPMDNSFEGLAEKDIILGKPIGYHARQINNENQKKMHYTTQVGACGGTTVHNSEIWKCAKDDIKLRGALNGSSEIIADGFTMHL